MRSPLVRRSVMDFCGQSYHWGGPRLDQLDAIAEGIAKFKAVVPRNRDRLGDCNPRAGKLLAPRHKIIDFICHVSLAGTAIDSVFDADVKLLVPYLNPEPAALLERCGLLDFPQPQHAAVERPPGLFSADRDRDLDVMNAANG